MMIRKLLSRNSRFFALGALLVGASLSTAALASELLPDLDFSRDFPDQSRLRQSFVPASATGSYQIRMIGDKFAAVFTGEGAPVAIFDLSLNPLSLTEVALGGFGLGDLNPLKLIRTIQDMRRARKQGNAIAGSTEATPLTLSSNRHLTGGARERALKTGQDFFKNIRLSDAWATRHGVTRLAGDDRPGIAMPQGASFSLADVEFKNEEQRGFFRKLLLKLARGLYPEEGWNDGNVLGLASEMEFRYVDAKPGYELVYNRGLRTESKPAQLPGVVVNYLYPWDNLGYKYTYMQIDQYAQHMERALGPVGILIEMFFSRVCHGLIERIETHERQLIALLEAQERFEYDANLPASLVDITTELLYLSAVHNYGNAKLMDGPGKRQAIRANQEKSREKIRKRLARQSGRGFTFTEFGDGKFVVARDKEGQFKGIISSALAPHFLFRYTSTHIGGNGPLFKVVERNATEIASFLARVFVPTGFGFKIGNFQGGISVEPMLYEMMIRGRLVAEQNLEGELTGLIDEAIAGRISLPLSAEELAKLRKDVRTIQINPYEISLEREKDVVLKNLALLKQVVASGNAASRFRPTTLLPMVP